MQYDGVHGRAETHFSLNTPVQAVILLGHSTGCQDTVRYCKVIQKDAEDAAPLAGVILQAPVRILLA